jgi:hypothetical protein
MPMDVIVAGDGIGEDPAGITRERLVVNGVGGVT